MPITQLRYVILCLVFVSCSVSRQHASSTAGASKNRTLVWNDEFNYTGLPDSTKWDYEEGFVRNKEPQYYTRRRLENCRVENGMLVIEARKENYHQAAYTSASITTLHKADWAYGRIEVRVKLPKGAGSWPAIWMLGINRDSVKWPRCGEIDIMEFTGHDSSSIYGTVHYARANGGHGHSGAHPVVGKPWEAFHVYAAEWNKDSIAFYYDNLNYFVFHTNQADTVTQQIFRRRFYLLLNLALGRQGTLGGVLDDGILPLRYYIDYVRVYR